jgi:hypothetical protein
MLNRRSASPGVGLSVSPDEDSPDSTPPARALRSRQTGQNSAAPERSLPQLGQVRCGSVIMTLTACSRNLSRKPHHAPPSGAKLADTAMAYCCSSVARAIACSVTVAREIALRNKIPAARVLRRLVLIPAIEDWGIVSSVHHPIFCSVITPKLMQTVRTWKN